MHIKMDYLKTHSQTTGINDKNRRWVRLGVESIGREAEN